MLQYNYSLNKLVLFELKRINPASLRWRDTEFHSIHVWRSILYRSVRSNILNTPEYSRVRLIPPMWLTRAADVIQEHPWITLNLIPPWQVTLALHVNYKGQEVLPVESPHGLGKIPDHTATCLRQPRYYSRRGWTAGWLAGHERGKGEGRPTELNEIEPPPSWVPKSHSHKAVY